LIAGESSVGVLSVVRNPTFLGNGSATTFENIMKRFVGNLSFSMGEGSLEGHSIDSPQFEWREAHTKNDDRASGSFQGSISLQLSFRDYETRTN
jgi:hypothetical protein